MEYDRNGHRRRQSLDILMGSGKSLSAIGRKIVDAQPEVQAILYQLSYISAQSVRTLQDLDRTSPRFCNQLISFLHGNEYRDVAPRRGSGSARQLSGQCEPPYCFPPSPTHRFEETERTRHTDRRKVEERQIWNGTWLGKTGGREDVLAAGRESDGSTNERGDDKLRADRV